MLWSKVEFPLPRIIPEMLLCDVIIPKAYENASPGLLTGLLRFIMVRAVITLIGIRKVVADSRCPYGSSLASGARVPVFTGVTTGLSTPSSGLATEAWRFSLMSFSKSRLWRLLKPLQLQKGDYHVVT